MLMLFESPHANLQVICSVTRQKRHPVTGDVIETMPGIWANFGKLGDEYQFTNPETGEMMTGATITGHFFDTEEEAREHDWDDDTKEMVERKLLGLCRREPSRIKQVEREIARAAAPWPTYDDADADQVVALASQLGLVEAALAYERENRARPAVLDALAGSTAVEPAPVEAPVAAKPGRVADPSLRTITV
jgi:hypothetical protein